MPRKFAEQLKKDLNLKVENGVPTFSKKILNTRGIYIKTGFSHSGIVRSSAGVISGILSLSNDKVTLLRKTFLACKNKTECEEIFKRNPNKYSKDKMTDNYLNKNIHRKERLMNEKLVTRKWWNQEKITLKHSIMAMLIEADKKMFKRTGKHILISSTYRHWDYQFKIYKRLKPKGVVVGKPGNSFHGTGQALDVKNWKQAEPYLFAVGFKGGSKGYKGDPVHFSVGEWPPYSDTRKMMAKYGNMEINQKLV